MPFNKIEDLAKSDVHRVAELADRPNRPQQYGTCGLTADELKKWFDSYAEGLHSVLSSLIAALADSKRSGDFIRLDAGELGVSLADLVAAVDSGAFAAAMQIAPAASEKKSLLALVNEMLLSLSEAREECASGREELAGEIRREVSRLGGDIAEANGLIEADRAAAEEKLASLSSSLSANAFENLTLSVKETNGSLGQYEIILKNEATGEERRAKIDLPIESSVVSIAEERIDGEVYLVLTARSGDEARVKLDDVVQGFAKAEALEACEEKAEAAARSSEESRERIEALEGDAVEMKEELSEKLSNRLRRTASEQRALVPESALPKAELETLGCAAFQGSLKLAESRNLFEGAYTGAYPKDLTGEYGFSFSVTFPEAGQYSIKIYNDLTNTDICLFEINPDDAEWAEHREDGWDASFYISYPQTVSFSIWGSQWRDENGEYPAMIGKIIGIMVNRGASPLPYEPASKYVDSSPVSSIVSLREDGTELDRIELPTSELAELGFGVATSTATYNYVDFTRGVFVDKCYFPEGVPYPVERAEPIETDISALLAARGVKRRIAVEPRGAVVFEAGKPEYAADMTDTDVFATLSFFCELENAPLTVALTEYAKREELVRARESVALRLEEIGASIVSAEAALALLNDGGIA